MPKGERPGSRDWLGGRQRRVVNTGVLLIPGSISLVKVEDQLRSDPAASSEEVEDVGRFLEEADAWLGQRMVWGDLGELDEHVLQWEWQDTVSGIETEERTNVAPILKRFIDLADAAPRKFLSFAKQFGPLFLCQHGEPFTHYGRPVENHEFGPPERGVLQWDLRPKEIRQIKDDFLRSAFFGSSPEPCVPQKLESLAVWRRYAREVRAVVQIAVRLHERSRRPELADYRELVDVDIDRSRGSYAEVIYELTDAKSQAVREWDQEDEEQWRSIVRRTQWLWRRSGVRAYPDWNAGRQCAEVVVQGCGVLGAVAVELAHYLEFGENPFTMCDACFQPFVPDRKRRSGEARYCGKPLCLAAGNARRVQKARARRKDAI